MYEYIIRSTGFPKIFQQGTVSEKRKQEADIERWEDNIKDWTGLPLRVTLILVKDRKEWREIVNRLCVGPQWSKGKGTSKGGE